MLNADGTSVHTDIYTRDAIDNVYGSFGDIYGSFFEMLYEMVASSTIAGWKVLPYDWRFQLDDLITNGAESGSGNISYIAPAFNPFLLREIRALAEDSQTGHVTIIAHSNGGLLAKS